MFENIYALHYNYQYSLQYKYEYKLLPLKEDNNTHENI